MISFLILFVIFNILYQNIAWIILFVILVAGYLYFFLQWMKKVKLKISEEGFYIGTHFLPWNSLNWFTLEIDPLKKTIKNIVLLKSNGDYLIHTIAEEDLEKVKHFALELTNYIPVLESYNQSFFDKLIRLLKI